MESNIYDNEEINLNYLNHSNFESKIICSNSGGYIAANSNLYKFIPQDTLYKSILKEAVKGTPMIKIGNSSPKVMVVAGIHGNELPPQLACLYLINKIVSKQVNGTIYLIPFAAPKATMNNSRSINGVDLNRATSTRGSISNVIYNIIQNENITAVADFHSTAINSNPGKEAVFCTIKPTKESFLIGQYISSVMDCHVLNYNEAGYPYKGALEDECNLIGIPSITCEVLSPFGYLKENSYKRSLIQMNSFLSYFGIL